MPDPGQPLDDPELLRRVDRLRRLVRVNGHVILKIGDLLVEIDARWGQRTMYAAAQMAGMAETTAKQRHWVSQRFPPHSETRRLGLDYGHLRVLVPFEDADAQAWAEQAVDEGWSVHRLQQAVNRRRRGAAPTTEMPTSDECDVCRFTGTDEWIRVIMPSGARLHFCSEACLVRYFSASRGRRAA